MLPEISLDLVLRVTEWIEAMGRRVKPREQTK